MSRPNRTQILLEYYYRGEADQKYSIKSDEITDEITSYPDVWESGESDEWNGMVCEGGVESSPMVPRQIQDTQIRAIAANLRRIADAMQSRHELLPVAVNQVDLPEQGLNEEEIQVARRIYADRTSITIDKISRYLQECLTARTFRMVLGFLSSNMASVSEELAVACELVRLIYPRVREAIQSRPIFDELDQFVEERWDEVLH